MQVRDDDCAEFVVPALMNQYETKYTVILAMAVVLSESSE